jgi:hypothetical protein
MLPGSIEVFSIIGKTERIHGGFDLIAEFNFFFVEFYVFHDNFIDAIIRFG